MAELFNNNSEQLISDLDRINSAFTAIEGTTKRNNKEILTYSKNMENLNKQLEHYVQASAMQGGAKFKTPNGTKGLSSQARILENNAKALGKQNKATADLLKLLGGREASAALSKMNGLASSLGTLGTTAGVAGASITLLGASIIAMGVAGKKAYENNLKLNRSLLAVGAAQSELTKSTSDTANKLIASKNRLKDAGQSLSEAFIPVVDVFADLANTASSFIKNVSSAGNSDSNIYNNSNSKLRWYTSELSKYGVSELNSVPTISSIAATSKQSGFDNSSAANLAIGTYDLAVKKAQELGLESQEVAKQLADAWQKGSDAAKDYGVVINDQVLAGYMSSKGVDIVNVQITDAMKQYYRYQLMQEEMSADNNDAMQEQIKEWTKLGFVIDQTKGKLQSFDEVINLQATDTTIPEVGAPSVNWAEYGDLNEEDPAKNIAQTRENTEAEKENTEAEKENTEATKENAQAHNEAEEALAREGQELGNVISQFQQGNIDISEFIDKLDSLAQSGNQWAQVMENITSAYATLIEATQNESTKMTAQLMYTQMLNLYMSTLDTNIEAVDEAMQALSETTAALSAVLVTDTQAARDAANAYNQLANALNNAAQAYRNKLAAMNATSTVSTATNGSSSKVKTTLTNLGNTFSKVGTAGKTVANSSVANGITFGASSGIVNGISNAKSNESLTGKVKSVVSGTIAGVASNIANKATFGGASVSSDASGKLSAHWSFNNLSPLEILDYVDAVQQNNWDWAGTASEGLASSITGMPSTFGNQGGGAKGVASAGLWSLLEEYADILNAAKYSQYVLNKDKAAELQIAQSNIETLMDCLQQGFTPEQINRLLPLVVKNGDESLETIKQKNTALQSTIQAMKSTYTLGGSKGVDSMLTQVGLETGGIGIKETTARLFENNKKEAVIPLETEAGHKFMAEALEQALVNINSGDSNITNNININGGMFEDYDSLQRLAELITEVQEQLNQRRGDLGYGSN